MGYAIASGITGDKKQKKINIFFLEKNPERITFLKKNNFIAFKDLNTLLRKNNKSFNIIILAIKPGELAPVASIVKNVLKKDTLLISVLAGTSLKKLSKLFHRIQPIIRIMPNLPCAVQQGAIVVAFNKNVNPGNKAFFYKVFNNLGHIFELKEKKFNIVTAISGSGPAYLCYFLECLIKISNNLGLNKKIAESLVLQTAYGTLELLKNKKIKAQELRNMVTSKKGTTEAAIKVFENERINKIIFKAIKAAKTKAGELSKT